MRVILARTAGFCMGVKRAMDTVLKAAEEEEGQLFTYGPLIHNKHVVNLLEKKGVKVTDSPEVPAGSRVVIRAHGVPKEIKGKIESCGAKVIDATCPHVLRSQRVIEKYSDQGYSVIIIGDKQHAEIIGLASYVKTSYQIISSLEEIENIRLDEPIVVVAQTTFNRNTYKKICEALKNKFSNIHIIESICSSTENRQQEIRELAKKVDAVIVVGDKKSANTVRLYQIVSELGVPAFHVETASDLELEELKKYELIGVTAGASTPSWIVNEVITEIESIGKRENLLKRIGKWIIASNLYAGVGAAAVTFTSCQIQKIHTWRWEYLFIAFAYVFTIYIFGRIIQGSKDVFNPSFRTAFVKQHYKILLPIGIIITILCILAAMRLNPTILGITIGAYLLGSAYIFHRIAHQKENIFSILKKIPASKDIITASAWTVVAVLIPFIHSGNSYTKSVIAAFIFVFLITFFRAVAFDFADIERDRILGEDTLPVYFGASKASIILKFIILILVITLLLFLSNIDIFLSICLCGVAVYMYFILYLLENRKIQSELITEFAVDSAFIVSGVLGGVSFVLH